MAVFVYGTFPMVPAALLVFTPIQKADPQEWESRLSHGWPRWVRLRLGFRHKVWVWAWSWASQQDCAVRWQMVTRAGKVTEMASSSIRGGCGGSPLRAGPLTEQSVSRQEQQASLHVSAVIASFDLSAWVCSKRARHRVYTRLIMFHSCSFNISVSLWRICSHFCPWFRPN